MDLLDVVMILILNKLTQENSTLPGIVSMQGHFYVYVQITVFLGVLITTCSCEQNW